MVEQTNKGNLMNIKDNFYIYYFNKLNKSIEEQKHTKENDIRNSRFDIITHQYTPIQTSYGLRDTIHDRTQQ
jgi:hypothetical protein